MGLYNAACLLCRFTSSGCAWHNACPWRGGAKPFCQTGVAVQVRGAASVTAEREARALAALEKSSAERAAALAAREKLLQEREEKVSDHTMHARLDNAGTQRQHCKQH
jgi:hypothetical protein